MPRLAHRPEQHLVSSPTAGLSRTGSLPRPITPRKLMPIDVTCPGCKTRFPVSEKFAGKQGPCPKCKTVIKIPEPKDQVIIHSPELEGPKDPTGQLVLKPIARKESRLSAVQLVAIFGGVVVVLIVALFLRINYAK